MNRRFSIGTAVAMSLVMANPSYALIGGPFDQGYYPNLEQGTYEVTYQIPNGNGMARFVAANSNPALSFYNYSLVFYRGVIYQGNAAGSIDPAGGIATGFSNGSSTSAAFGSGTGGNIGYCNATWDAEIDEHGYQLTFFGDGVAHFFGQLDQDFASGSATTNTQQNQSDINESSTAFSNTENNATVNNNIVSGISANNEFVQSSDSFNTFSDESFGRDTTIDVFPTLVSQSFLDEVVDTVTQVVLDGEGNTVLDAAGAPVFNTVDVIERTTTTVVTTYPDGTPVLDPNFDPASVVPLTLDTTTNTRTLPTTDLTRSITRQTPSTTRTQNDADTVTVILRNPETGEEFERTVEVTGATDVLTTNTGGLTGFDDDITRVAGQQVQTLTDQIGLGTTGLDAFSNENSRGDLVISVDETTSQVNQETLTANGTEQSTLDSSTTTGALGSSDSTVSETFGTESSGFVTTGGEDTNFDDVGHRVAFRVMGRRISHEIAGNGANSEAFAGVAPITGSGLSIANATVGIPDATGTQAVGTTVNAAVEPDQVEGFVTELPGIDRTTTFTNGISASFEAPE